MVHNRVKNCRVLFVSLFTCQKLHIFLVIKEPEFPPIADVILQNFDSGSNVLEELVSISTTTLFQPWEKARSFYIYKSLLTYLRNGLAFSYTPAPVFRRHSSLGRRQGRDQFLATLESVDEIPEYLKYFSHFWIEVSRGIAKIGLSLKLSILT